MSSGTVLSPKRVLFLSLALALGGFGIGSGEFVIMGLISRVATDLQVSPADVGYAISSYALGVVLGAPVISALSARLPRRALLICLMLVFAVANVATWAGNLFGWEIAFTGVGVIALLTAFLIWLWVPRQAVDPMASPARELSALFNQQLLITLGVASIGFGGMFAVFSYVMPTLTGQAGMAEQWGPLVLMIFGVGTIIGNLAGARLADGNLLRAIPMILVWCVLVQAGFYVAANNMIAGMVFVGLVGTCMAMGPALQTRLMDVAGDGQTMAASMNHAAFNMANALGAWLAGVTVKSGAVWSTTGLVGAALAIGGLLIFFAGRQLERRATAAHQTNSIETVPEPV